MNQDEKIRQLQLQVFNLKDMVQRLVVENKELRDVVIQYANSENGAIAQAVLDHLYDPQKLQQLLKLQRDTATDNQSIIDGKGG